MGRLLVIEGTDCSGKETQTNKLIEYLNKRGEKVVKFSFPMYDTPTGKIVGGPILGKKNISEGWFKETVSNVEPKVTSLYYAADRRYNIGKVKDKLKEGYTVILDRFTHSNMAHQGSKIKLKKDRLKMYKWLDKLEFDFLELPRPDAIIFLHMPVKVAEQLRKNRKEGLDEAERDINHLIASEKAYLELAQIYNYYTIKCFKNDKPRSIDDIFKDVIKTYDKIVKAK
ncbi:MAG: hypothetical protein GX951_02330 [Mollicutes bacterium]|nr:hypothetical protein [Mollicutes bacterium]